MAVEMFKVTARTGHEIEVDISDEACGKYGFKHGDRVIVLGDCEASVAGVGPAAGEGNPEPEVLWFVRDDRGGRASYCYPLDEGDLRPL